MHIPIEIAVPFPRVLVRDHRRRVHRREFDRLAHLRVIAGLTEEDGT